MKTDWFALFAEIAELAEQQHRPDLAAAARNCSAIDRKKLFAVATQTSDRASSLTDWLRREAPAAEMRATPLSTLAEHPLEAYEADQVVVELPMGTFLDGTTYEQVQRVALSRPPGTYAIVFAGVESVMIPEDVERFESGVKRLLLSDDVSGANGAANRDPWQPIVLFSLDEPSGLSPELDNRLAKDRALLSVWIARSRSHETDLCRYRALVFCDVLDQDEPVGPQPDGDKRESQVRQHREAVRECQRKLIALVERAFGSLDRELSTSLMTYSQNLPHMISPVLQDRIRLNKDAASLERLVRDLCTEVVERWSGQTWQTIQARYHELYQDALASLEDVSWPDVNVALAALNSRPYPESLRQLFQLEVQTDVHQMFAGQRLPGVYSGLMKGTMYGTTVGATAGALLVGPLGCLIGAGLGAIGGAVAGQRFDQHDLLAQAARSASTLVAESTGQQMDTVRRKLQDQLHEHRQRLDDQFQEILGALDKVLQTPAQTTSSAPPTEFEQRLASLRERIVTCDDR